MKRPPGATPASRLREVRADGDVVAAAEKLEREGSTALHFAVASGQTELLEGLLAAGCPVDARDNADNTPLHIAAGCGFADAVARLLTAGADVDARDVTQCTPLQNAAHGTYSALAQPCCLGAAEKKSSRVSSDNGEALTASQQAAQTASGGIAPRADGLVPMRSGLAAACRGGDGALKQDRAQLQAVATRLVRAGALMEAADLEGRTALHLAAGCGDAAMVSHLLHLGADANATDSVGGTAMHHAAMSNHRELMVALARMGCDPNARADGIQGATAAFVLCSQHAKTSQQLTGLTLLLRKAHKLGRQARAAGRSPSPSTKVGDGAAERAAQADRPAEGMAAADAHMEELLAELQAEASAGKDVPKKRKKAKKAARASGAAEHGDAAEVEAPAVAVPTDTAQEAAMSKPAPAAAPAETHLADGDTARAPVAASPAAVEPVRAARRSSAVDADVSSAARQDEPTADAERGQAEPVHPRASSAVGNGNVAVNGPVRALSEDGEIHHRSKGRHAGAGDRIRGHERSLSRVSCDSTVSSSLSEQPAGGPVPDQVGEGGFDGGPCPEGFGTQQAEESARTHLAAVAAEAMQAMGSIHLFAQILERLDDAIELATRRGVSTKYAKKVRRRLLSSLDGPKPADPVPRCAAAAMEPPAPSTPPAAAGAVSGSVFGSAIADACRDIGSHAESRRLPNGAAVPRDALLPAEVKPRAAAAQPVVNHGALLAALLPRAKPKSSARVRTGEEAPTTAERVPNGLLSSQMGMASSMGGSLPAHAAAAQQQPGQYRGAASLDMPDGGSVFAHYGAPTRPQLPGSQLAAEPLGTAPEQPSGSDSQLHSQRLSNGSDAVGPVSPLFRHANGDAADPAGGAAVHSRQSSGWTGFDGPAFGGGGLMGTSFASAVSAVGSNGLRGTVAVEQQHQQLTSLHAARQVSDLPSHCGDLRLQHSDLHSQLQRASLRAPDFELRPDDCRLPSHVVESLFDDEGSDISEAHEVALDMRAVQELGLSAIDSRSAKTEDRLVPKELIGNLDLYL